MCPVRVSSWKQITSRWSAFTHANENLLCELRDGALSILNSVKHLDAGQEYNSVRAIIENCIPVALSAREIEEASYNDAGLSQVKGCVRTGNWEHCTFPSYAHVKDELCIYGEILLGGSRIVVPKTLQNKVVRLRSKVWWPGMDKDVEQLCKVCHGCQVISCYDPPEPMSHVLLPSAPWQDCRQIFLDPCPKDIWL